MPRFWFRELSRVLRRLGSHLSRRLGEAACLPSGTSSKAALTTDADNPEGGSAVVEFTFLALLLMVPVVYFVVSVAQIQGGAFAVVGAADQAAKVLVLQDDSGRGRTAAEQAVLVALEDYGFEADQARVDISCDGNDCAVPGTKVTVSVRLAVPLPMVPFGDGLQLNAARVSASATQVVGRFR